MDFFIINVTDAEIGWRRVPQKSKKRGEKPLRCSMVALDHRKKTFLKK